MQFLLVKVLTGFCNELGLVSKIIINNYIIQCQGEQMFNHRQLECFLFLFAMLNVECAKIVLINKIITMMNKLNNLHTTN